MCSSFKCSTDLHIVQISDVSSKLTADYDRQCMGTILQLCTGISKA